MQGGQIAMYCSPQDFKVDLEISVSEHIAHVVSKPPRNLWMGLGIGGKLFCYVVAGFANDFKVSNHRILSALIICKRLLVHVLYILANSFDGFDNVRKIIRQARGKVVGGERAKMAYAIARR